MGTAPCELLVYRFDGLASSPEGHLIGALERVMGRAIAVREVLVVMRAPRTGELSVLRLHPRGAQGRLVADATDFRLDEGRRRAQSERALAEDEGGRIEALAADLPPGSGVVALVLEHRWLDTLGESIDRAGGRLATRRALPRDAAVDLADEALLTAH